MKSDQENAIGYLVKEFVEARGEGKTHVEDSVLMSSGSNGVAERGIHDTECKRRAIFLGFQEGVGMSFDARERVVSFIPEYAAYLMNRLKVGEDGKTVYERVGECGGTGVW